MALIRFGFIRQCIQESNRVSVFFCPCSGRCLASISIDGKMQGLVPNHRHRLYDNRRSASDRLSDVFLFLPPRSCECHRYRRSGCLELSLWLGVVVPSAHNPHRAAKLAIQWPAEADGEVLQSPMTRIGEFCFSFKSEPEL